MRIKYVCIFFSGASILSIYTMTRRHINKSSQMKLNNNNLPEIRIDRYTHIKKCNHFLKRGYKEGKCIIEAA